MAKTLQEWVDTDVQQIAKDYEDCDLYREGFFRNPHRTIIKNPNIFYAPADGVIINQKFVTNLNDPLMVIKGKEYSLKYALGNNDKAIETIEKAGGAFVCDIFMTFYSVHINRVPVDSFLSYEKISCAESYNKSMLDVEENLFKGKFDKAIQNLEYMFTNERVLSTCHAPGLGINYFMVQIADVDVNSIQQMNVPYKDMPNTHLYQQGSCFGNIRYGSQTTLVIPYCDKYEISPNLEVGMVVEAGVDPICTLVKG